MIGAPTSATICGRSVSFVAVERVLAAAAGSACRKARVVDQSVSSNARRAAAMARSMSSAPAVGDLAR